MVVIEGMSMPSRCMNCELLGKEVMYCPLHPRKDLDVITVATNRPNWCSLREIDEHKIEKLEEIEKLINTGTYTENGKVYSLCDDNDTIVKCIRTILEKR